MAVSLVLLLSLALHPVPIVCLRSAVNSGKIYAHVPCPGDIATSLSGAGVKLGLAYRLIPLGPNPSHGIHFIDIIARVAMMFGGVTPGDTNPHSFICRGTGKSNSDCFPAGLVDDEIAFVDGMRVLGFPILSLGRLPWW